MCTNVTTVPNPLTRGPAVCHIKSMKELLPSLLTEQLANLVELLEVNGSTDEDWTIYEVALTLLKDRADCPMWAHYYEV